MLDELKMLGILCSVALWAAAASRAARVDRGDLMRETQWLDWTRTMLQQGERSIDDTRSAQAFASGRRLGCNKSSPIISHGRVRIDPMDSN
jgi:hypothetical protein